jgi:hypothetical protein
MGTQEQLTVANSISFPWRSQTIAPELLRSALIDRRSPVFGNVTNVSD